MSLKVEGLTPVKRRNSSSDNTFSCSYLINTNTPKQSINTIYTNYKKFNSFERSLLGFEIQNAATLKVLTEDVIKSSEIEGEILNLNHVRSSIARRLGIDVGGDIVVDRNVEGIVDIMLDATQNFDNPMSKDRLIGWHAALFPTGYSGLYKIDIGNYRSDKFGRMQVISGHIGKETVHYEAPKAEVLESEMNALLNYINTHSDIDLIIQAGIVHLWFVTLHPFDDGNGRIARALADMILARRDTTKHRFYSMSSQIRKERSSYYDILEKTQKGNLDITRWLEWFLQNLFKAITSSDEIIEDVLKKADFWNKHLSVNFNDRQRKVLNRLFDDFQGHLTSMKWAKICKCSQDAATNDINDLIDKKILKKVGSARATHYVVKN